jgi:Cu+-exporting ATPase
MDQGVIARTGTDLQVYGMSCAGCAARVQRALLAVPGVLAAEVNLASERVRVRAAGPTAFADLAAAVRAAGYDAAEPEAAAQAPRRDHAGVLALLALLCAAPLLLPMLLEKLGLHADLPGWAQLALATVVQVGFGARFYRAAWRAARAGTASMDTLVSLGTTAAFGLSLWGLARGGPLYFEASASVIALVRLGKYLEARARRETGAALRALARLAPEHARVLRGSRERELPARALRPGDLLVIRPGERIAADAVVREGTGSADESLLTGESLPVAKQPGSPLIGGAVNGEARLVAEVTATGAESRLARLIRLVEDAQAARPPTQHLVDRVSAGFVPVVIGIAVLTFLGWWAAGAGIGTAIVTSVAVLVVACPCALGLATPAAILAGTGAAARHGIVIRDPVALEQARAIRTVLFDKTGTLTEGRPRLLAVHPASGQAEAEVVRLAAALQAGSEHPLARAVLAAAGEVPPAREVRALPGRGVEGMVGDRRLILGSARLMQEEGVALAGLETTAATLEAAGRSVAFLAEGCAPLGLLGFGDAPRQGAAAAVAALRARGLLVALLTGDGAGAAAAVAQALGIDAVHAATLPEDKRHIVARYRADGPVAMVGDGVNDAAALAEADLGIAMQGATDAAVAAAGISLLRADPLLVPAALDIARRTAARIRQGLFWAFAYNIVALPLAAAGLLSPTLAGAAMAASSVGVVVGALGLRRWRP